MVSTTAPKKSPARTFEYQDKLPRLPVPDLEKSLEGYIKSIVPLLEQKYGSHALPKELEKRKLFAKDFASKDGLGRVLQERLKDLDHISPNNWLDDTLWLALAYHTWRAPMLVNSNWWLLFASDPQDPAPPVLDGATNKTTVPLNANPSHDLPAGSEGGGKPWLDSHTDKKAYYQAFKYEDVTKVEWITDWQVRRAAWLTRRFAEYRTQILREELPPHVSKAGPMCMSQFSKIFNFSRIPQPSSDAFSVIDNQALHTTVMIDDFIYSIDVFQQGADGIPEPIPAGEIERLFQAAVEDAKKRKDAGEQPARVGILSADHRDTWTVNREKVILFSPKNRETLANIDSSLIVVSLDPYTLPTQPTEDPLRQAPIDAQMHNTQGGLFGGRNRWFDKPLSILVENNGRAAVMGEHSPVDALLPSMIVDYALAEPVDDAQFSVTKQILPALGQGFQREDFVVDSTIQDEIEAVAERNQKIVDDSDASTLWWAEFGGDWIKKVAKQSPDGFMQQALQLAWFRDQGNATATYETASTRGFKHGRTDVIRTLSVESRSFVSSMDNASLDDAKRYELLTKAVAEHNALTKRSSAGGGWDRHLMGLKVQLRPGETHPLFEDELYAKSQEWKLSTSGLSSGIRFMATGFGAAWPDGYGINYMIAPHIVKFGLESKVSCPTTSTTRLKHNIVQALRDMRRVCEAASTGKDEKAKL
ncbi:hypothetical protein Q8F55_000311 [Vanrija albida]|uniref:Choline/carnitine acyltransferase domain-containing protein n=1 Tax=Vanrija albida TaxID=181172 RepID=A0ABR3QCX6_9TREE